MREEWVATRPDPGTCKEHQWDLRDLEVFGNNYHHCITCGYAEIKYVYLDVKYFTSKLGDLDYNEAV